MFQIRRHLHLHHFDYEDAKPMLFLSASDVPKQSPWRKHLGVFLLAEENPSRPEETSGETIPEGGSNTGKVGARDNLEGKMMVAE